LNVLEICMFYQKLIDACQFLLMYNGCNGHFSQINLSQWKISRTVMKTEIRKSFICIVSLEAAPEAAAMFPIDVLEVAVDVLAGISMHYKKYFIIQQYHKSIVINLANRKIKYSTSELIYLIECPHC